MYQALFQQVLSINLNVARYKPLKGSSYIELPKALVSNRAIVNVKNTDNECFRWSVLSALCDSYDTKHPERSFKKLSKMEHDIDFSAVSFPTPLTDIPRFEKANNIAC